MDEIHFENDGRSFASLQNVSLQNLLTGENPNLGAFATEVDGPQNHSMGSISMAQGQNQPPGPINIDYSLMKKPGDFMPGNLVNCKNFSTLKSCRKPYISVKTNIDIFLR